MAGWLLEIDIFNVMVQGRLVNVLDEDGSHVRWMRMLDWLLGVRWGEVYVLKAMKWKKGRGNLNFKKQDKGVGALKRDWSCAPLWIMVDTDVNKADLKVFPKKRWPGVDL